MRHCFFGQLVEYLFVDVLGCLSVLISSLLVLLVQGLNHFLEDLLEVVGLDKLLQCQFLSLHVHDGLSSWLID